MLYDKYHAGLYRYSLKFIKSGELAEEVVQDVFMKVWENRHLLDPNLSIKAYLYKICKNCLINLLIRATKEKAIKQRILYYADIMHNQTENTLIYEEYEKIAWQAIEHLSPQRQLVFKMCRLEGRSYEEVAQQLGISKGTVSDHMVKAAKFIKEYLFTHAKIASCIIHTSAYLLIVM